MTNKKITLSDVPISGSLGLLAYGDVAFDAWRKVKIENNIFNREKQEVNTNEKK